MLGLVGLALAQLMRELATGESVQVRAECVEGWLGLPSMLEAQRAQSYFAAATGLWRSNSQ